MESAITTIVTTFMKYSNSKGNLKSCAFKKMIQNNLGTIMEDTENPDAIREMEQGLDENKDEKVGFEEYLKLIKYVADVMSKRRSESSQAAS